MSQGRRKFLETTLLASAGLPIILSCSGISETDSFSPIIASKTRVTIAITAPGGAVFNYQHIRKTQAFLEKQGFFIKLGKTLTTKSGYFSNEDEFRGEELNTFFADPEVDIILCARGGWGCNRILPFINLETIKKNKKALVGFSDITTLLNYIHFQTGLITYHGNMAYSSWGAYSFNSFQKTIIDQSSKSIENHSNNQIEIISKGTASGKLIGGNLTVLTSMIGTNYEPIWKNNILCIEETHEEPYRVDRMLCQLKDCGALEQLNGVLIGQFNQCEPENPEQSFSLSEVLHQYFSSIRIPVFSNLSFGHVQHKFTIPIGQQVSINSDKKSIVFIS